MKGFEFFKKQYDERHQVMVERINPQYPDGTYEFVHIAWQYFFGDAKADGWFRVNGIDDIEWMYEQKYMRKIERSSWEARQRGQQYYAALTIKGLKHLYKNYIKPEYEASKVQ